VNPYGAKIVEGELLTFTSIIAVDPLEILRKISQNLSPAGVTSPFLARAMPTDWVC
jgi:hypothetical protein